MLLFALGKEAYHRINRYLDKGECDADAEEQRLRSSETVAGVHIQTCAEYHGQGQQHTVFITEFRQERSHEKRNDGNRQVFEGFQNAGFRFRNAVVGQGLFDNDADAVE